MPSLLPDDPAPPAPHAAVQTTPKGQQGGPSFTYRGSTIHSNERETLFTLVDPPEGLPGTWGGCGNIGVITRVVDAWLDHRRLPQGYLMPGEKAGAAVQKR